MAGISLSGACFGGTIAVYGAPSFSGFGTLGASAFPSGNSLIALMPNFSVGSSQTGSAMFTDPVTQSGELAGFTYDFSSFTGLGTGTVTLIAGGLQFSFDLLHPVGFFALPNAPLSFTLEADISLTGVGEELTSLPGFSLTAEAPEPVTAPIVGVALAALGLLLRGKVRKNGRA
jgi:hypothetical protein